MKQTSGNLAKFYSPKVPEKKLAKVLLSQTFTLCGIKICRTKEVMEVLQIFSEALLFVISN